MATVSKEEYLRKYLSKDDGEGKKKKKRPKIKNKQANSGLRIVDDDISVTALLPENLANTLEEDLGDDGPVLVYGVDVSPPRFTDDDYKTIKTASARRGKKWRTLGEESEEEEDEKSQRSPGSQSPIRRARHDSDSDQSQPRRKRHDSGSDQSPIRTKRHDSRSDQSPKRRKRHDSGSDQSPIRRKRHDSGSDQSPPRRKRHDSGSDQSPPRRKRHDSGSDQSPPRRKRHDSGSDQSPPRRKRHDSDQSPPRRKRHDSDQSPPRKGTNSKKRKSKQTKRDSDSDLSPPRKETTQRKRKSRFHSESPPRKSTEVKKDEHGRPITTLAGATAGLSSAKQMRKEAQMMRQREDDMFTGRCTLGRNAKTVVRDRHKKSKEELEEEAEAEKKAQQLADKYKRWNKGLKQAQMESAALQDAVHEMSKPLTRDRSDQDLEAMLRAVERDGDPMAAYLSKKRKADAPKKKALPRYSGPQPPQNRYNLWPGYRWDGVDRSNGFEKQIIVRAADKKAVKEIAYKWSVEDM